MNWTPLTVTGLRDRVAVIAALFREGAWGVQETDEGVVTHLPETTDLTAICAALRHADESALIAIGELAPSDERAIHGTVERRQVGALVIAPPWLDVPGPRTIVVEPGMGFGTGEHPTTRGVLRLLQQVVRPGDVVVDLGTGSAVLAVAAARLGARSVAAVEVDPDAIGNAEDTVRRNDLQAAVHVVEGDAFVLLPLLAPVDLVLANIVSSVVLPLLPVIRDVLRPEGRAIVSGLLYDERATVLDALASDGWRVRAEDREGEWWSATITR